MHQIFRKIIGLSLLFLSFYFALSALQWHQKYEDGKGEYEELAQENTEKPKTEAENGTKMDPYMKIDWEKLKEQNSDLVGWIVMDPNVNYPVVQGEDNAYYLHRGFNRGYNINGCIFMSSNNSPDWKDPNTIVYGHNMRNGTMFSSLKKMLNDSSIQEENPNFYVFTEDKAYMYEIFAVYLTQADSRTYDLIRNEEEQQGFLDYVDETATWRSDKVVSASDKVMTLSTCHGLHSNNRTIILGVLVASEDR